MSDNNQDEYQEFAEEYRHVKRDVAKVVITNVLILMALVGVYFVNRKTGFLNSLIEKIF